MTTKHTLRLLLSRPITHQQPCNSPFTLEQKEKPLTSVSDGNRTRRYTLQYLLLLWRSAIKHCWCFTNSIHLSIVKWRGGRGDFHRRLFLHRKVECWIYWEAQQNSEHADTQTHSTWAPICTKFASLAVQKPLNNIHCLMKICSAWLFMGESCFHVVRSHSLTFFLTLWLCPSNSCQLKRTVTMRKLGVLFGIETLETFWILSI